jgi:hypothetical protein
VCIYVCVYMCVCVCIYNIFEHKLVFVEEITKILFQTRCLGSPIFAVFGSWN